MGKRVFDTAAEGAFLSALARQKNVAAAIAETGVKTTTVYDRRRRNPAFAAAWDSALAQVADDPVAAALEGVMHDPQASPEVKVKAAQALHVRRRFSGRPWGSGVAEKRARGPLEGQQEAEAPVVPPRVAAIVEQAQRDATIALAMFRDRLPEQLYADAHSLVTTYNAVFSPRRITMAPHLAPMAIALADESIPNLLIVCGPGSGKSTLISVCYPAWRLGRDPAHTVLEVSAGESLVDGFRLGVAGIIDESESYRALFPGTRPDKVRGWSSERGLFVEGHGVGDPDSSVFACGISSSVLTGRHARTLVLDDVHDRENSGTGTQRERVVATFYDTILGRADPQGARFIVAGRRFAEDDLYGCLTDAGNWVVMRLPAERTGTDECYFDVDIPDDLACGLRAICDPVAADDPVEQALAEAGLDVIDPGPTQAPATRGLMFGDDDGDE